VTAFAVVVISGFHPVSERLLKSGVEAAVKQAVAGQPKQVEVIHIASRSF